MTDTPRPCPLRFETLAKPRVWGGERLQKQLGKPPAEGGAPCGETWEIVDLADDQSVVAGGELRGVTLGELVSGHREWLMGEASLLDGRFPLLLKLIDAEKVLSVQVHPDGEAAERLGGRPKTESWVVLAAEPTSCLYLGLRRGVTREQLAEATKGSSLEHLINRVAVEPGDVIFIPAGTIHAIGGGLVLAEMQQASDTTYRLHDWGRVGLDGEPRQLHVEQALESIHFDQPDPPPWRPRRGPGRVVEGPDFTIELANLEKGGSASYERVRPMVVLCLEGRLEVAAGKKADRDQETILAKGECALIPAAAGGCRLSGLEDLTRAQVTWPT